MQDDRHDDPPGDSTRGVFFCPNYLTLDGEQGRNLCSDLAWMAGDIRREKGVAADWEEQSVKGDVIKPSDLVCGTEQRRRIKTFDKNR